MIMQRFKFFLIFGFFISVPQIALATCDPSVSTSGSSLAVNYNPFETNPTDALLKVNISNAGSSPCVLELNIVPDSGRNRLTGPGGAIRFSVVNADDWRISRRGQVSASLRTTLPAGPVSRTFDLPFRIKEGQIKGPGTYSEALRIELKERNKPGRSALLSDSVDFSAVINARVDAFLSFSRGAFGTGQSVNVFDLGILQTGLKDSVYLQLRGNTAARVTVQSQNGGKLIHQDNPSLGSIDYKMRVAGRPADMNSPVTVVRSLPPLERGRSFGLTFIIGQVNAQMAGVYKDIINVDVTSF
mgnify:CR=1 FL=1